MRYDEFRAEGLCVGSGVVEEGCKTAVGGPLQALRDALDAGRSQCHPGVALLCSQRALRGLLGAPCGGSLSGFRHNSDVYPRTKCTAESAAQPMV